MVGVTVLIGVGLMAAGGGMFWARKNAEARLFDIREARTATIAELTSLADGVAEEMGRGSWSEYVKVRGKIVAQEQLVAPLSKKPCVQYAVTVTREYEYEEETTDSEGHRKCETRRGSEVVSNQSEQVPFFVKDITGKALVEPSGAEVELVQTVSEFKREPGAYGGYGGISIDFGGHHGHGRKTLGYRYCEEILPLDRQALVVGQAADGTDGLQLRKPSKADDSMIISLRSEDELKASAASSAKWLGFGAIGAAAIGAIVFVVGLVSHDGGGTTRQHRTRRSHSALPPAIVAVVPSAVSLANPPL